MYGSALVISTLIDAALSVTTDNLAWSVVTKARRALDTVVRHDRLLVPSDGPSLPYLIASSRRYPVGDLSVQREFLT